jgi:hypothetical protein
VAPELVNSDDEIPSQERASPFKGLTSVQMGPATQNFPTLVPQLTDRVSWTSPSLDLTQATMAGSMKNETLLPFIMSIDPNTMALTYQTPVHLT